MKKHVFMMVLSSLWFVAPLGAQTTCVDDFENQAITDAGPEPFFTNGKCGDSYHRGFVSTSDAAHGKVFVGGSLFCPNGNPCSPTTDIFLPGPATNISFDLQSGFQTLVQTDGFSRLFPSPFSPATQFQWLHVVIPSTGSHITLTTNGFPSTHVIDNFTFTPAPPPPPSPPPTFVFELDDHYPGQKLLLHKYDPSDNSGPFSNGYFSNYQVTTIPLDQPPQFRFPGAVTVAGVATAKVVYVRVIDPPDTAPYVPHPAANDNLDPVRPKGTLFYLDTSGNRTDATPGGVLTMTANSDNVPGRANIFLEATDHVAGENYQLEASFDPTFPCATAGSGGTDACAKSVIVTTWKRIYLEVDSMFRRGTFLAAAVSSGAQQVTVLELTPGEPPPFLPGDLITFIHGDRGSSYFEDVVIDPNPTDAQGAPIAPIVDRHDGSWLIHLSTPLIHSYTGGGARWYYADAIGIQGEGFTPSTNALKSLYDPMFVDTLKLDHQPFQYFPFVDVIAPEHQGGAFHLLLARRWFYDLPPQGQTNGNIFHIIGAGKYVMTTTQDAQTGSVLTCTTHFGDTAVGVANYSYIYVGNIEATAAGPIPPCTFQLQLHLSGTAGFMNTDVAHESLHVWNVNHDPNHPHFDPANPGVMDGHCDAAAATPPGTTGDLCIMSRRWPYHIINWDQLNIPRYGLHWLDQGADSEYTQVRQHSEPVTQ